MKHTGTMLLLTCVIATSAGQAKAATVFTDGFEGSSLDPFWTPVASAGVVHFPATARVHSGQQSVAFESLPGGQKGAGLHHDFAQPIYGEVSVWLYDNWAGNANANYAYLQIYNTAAQEQHWVGIVDWDGGAYYEGNPRYSGPTSVVRTTGWHELSIASLPDGVTIKIDDTPVYTDPTGRKFDQMNLTLFGPSWRPNNMVAYYDDFRLTPVPEPTSVVGLISGAVICLFFFLGRRRDEAMRPIA
ncbi:MAG: PEP-CTERM sorting domain-containing protein [Pirellulales bacterium]